MWARRGKENIDTGISLGHGGGGRGEFDTLRGGERKKKIWNVETM